MEKKMYSSPLTEIMNVSAELMHLNSPSTTEFPGGPSGAPTRRTPVC